MSFRWLSTSSASSYLLQVLVLTLEYLNRENKDSRKIKILGIMQGPIACQILDKCSHSASGYLINDFYFLISNKFKHLSTGNVARTCRLIKIKVKLILNSFFRLWLIQGCEVGLKWFYRELCWSTSCISNKICVRKCKNSHNVTYKNRFDRAI